jgi:hypothetical protein
MKRMRFEQLVHKIAKDKKFRSALRASPTKALKRVGVTATPELVRSLKALNWRSIQKVNTHYKRAAGIST